MLLTPTASQDDGHDHGHHGSNGLRLPPTFLRRHLLWGAAGALAMTWDIVLAFGRTVSRPHPTAHRTQPC